MRHACSTAVAFIVAAGLAFAPETAGADGDCFERADNRKLAYDVFQISSPPRYSAATRDYAERSPVYPGTDYATTSVRMLKDDPAAGPHAIKFRKHYLLWVNRCIFLQGITPSAEACRNTTRTKGNGYTGMAGGPLKNQLRIAFSTYAKANACTTLNAMAVLGDPPGTIADRARSAGLTLVPTGTDHATLVGMARKVTAGVGARAETTTFLVDICVVETEAMGRNATGLVLDYEVFDYRTPSEALDFIRSLTELSHRHGKTLIVNTNPLPRDPNGINASNARRVLGVVDGFVPTISTGASIGNPDIGAASKERRTTPMDSYKLQLDVLTGSGRLPLGQAERAKLIWNISLHDTSLAEARQIREEVLTQGYRGIMIFRNLIRQGGACSRPNNQVTACLAFGECDGNFGAER